MKKARIIVLTGPGKGKTTSALGMVLRALGHGQTVLLTRFCKTSFSGELAVLEKIPGITVRSGDCGMTPPPSHPKYQTHVRSARALFAATVADAPKFDMVVMDEICGAAAKGLVDDKDVADFLARLRSDQIAILTGRNASVRLIAAADTASEILCLKHGHRAGISAQKGVER